MYKSVKVNCITLTLTQKIWAKISTNPAILDTSYELIALHIEVHSGGTMRGIPL